MKLASLLSLKAEESLGTGELTRKQVKMPKKEFIDEHKKLVRVLRKGSEKELHDEARHQWQELNEVKATAPPVGWFETYGSLSPVPTFHPPSLKNPIKVKQNDPTTGWKKDATKEQRKKAIQDLIEQHKRARRNIGKPEVSEVASFPLAPSIDRWQ